MPSACRDGFALRGKMNHSPWKCLTDYSGFRTHARGRQQILTKVLILLLSLGLRVGISLAVQPPSRDAGAQVCLQTPREAKPRHTLIRAKVRKYWGPSRAAQEKRDQGISSDELVRRPSRNSRRAGTAIANGHSIRCASIRSCPPVHRLAKAQKLAGGASDVLRRRDVQGPCLLSKPRSAPQSRVAGCKTIRDAPATATNTVSNPQARCVVDVGPARGREQTQHQACTPGYK